ncbi:MAG: glycosyltransferase [Thermoleophilia bacterium]
MYFSIIIPAKNEESYLAETLERICEQRKAAHLALEIIVVDGGSYDATVDIAKKYSDIVVTDIAATKSIAHGRNIGVLYSNGNVLIHTDADVHFADLDSLTKDIEALFQDQAYVAATAVIKPKPTESKKIDYFMHSIFNYSIRHSIFLGAFFSRGELQIVRKTAFEEIDGYNTNIVIGEDCNLFYRLKKIGKIKYFSNHHVLHSTRRFKKYGYLKTLLIYGREGLFLLFTGRNYLKDWEEIR